jgi:hypothetical protein
MRLDFVMEEHGVFSVVEAQFKILFTLIPVVKVTAV